MPSFSLLPVHFLLPICLVSTGPTMNLGAPEFVPGRGAAPASTMASAPEFVPGRGLVAAPAAAPPEAPAFEEPSYEEPTDSYADSYADAYADPYADPLAVDWTRSSPT